MTATSLRRRWLIAAVLALGAGGAAQAHVHWRVGIGVGMPYYPYYPSYYYDAGPPFWGGGWYAYALPPVVVQAPPVEVAPQPLGEAPPTFWYYCRNPAGYYPHVPACPEGWAAVPAVAPRR